MKDFFLVMFFLLLIAIGLTINDEINNKKITNSIKNSQVEAQR